MELFLYQIINHVKENMTSISLVDENYGQLDNIDDSDSDMYPITFPAVLIDLQEATWTNLAHSAQKGTVKVNVQLIIDCYDDTHAYSGTMEAIKQRAQLVEQLHALLQGYRPKDDGALIRESSKFYTANHGIKVYEMVYSVVTTSVINSRETVATPPHIALATGRL
jgi:hypothetical protein